MGGTGGLTVGVVIALIAIVAVIHNSKAIGLKVYASLTTITSLLGASIAARQVWLQLRRDA